MKVKVLTPTVREVKYLKVTIPYPCYENYEINGKTVEDIYDFPDCVRGKENTLEFAIKLDNGMVMGWDKGDTFSTCDKVRDGGTYTLMDENYNDVVNNETDYVPPILDTKGDGFGDYMQFSINAEGYIENYNLTLATFPVTLLS